ncbi:LLM class flavin-dependent oxidoreductase [Pseudoclavibacter chungangensis]|uniref:LLM class flavin-dependent oxidoreductase n=1 Tax=Pseudoclavibacter chungangensis TaxID=587635 RepID=A0A7J5BYX5_9MICO|nr:LLM class flavin-dependent oxidoreductase [Pseudoclavibacter chungangensis]
MIPRAGLTYAGNYPDADPAGGLEEGLELLVLAERLGYDTVGVRQRHLERGVSSALTVLAAASQRTERITLETNVVPLGFENPFRLAEDFATVWALARGRVHVGISSSAPHAELLAPLGRPDTDPRTDPYELMARFLDALRSEPLADEPLHTPYGPEPVPRLQPRIPDALRTVWLGGGSNRSVDWAAQRGLNLLLGNLTDAEGDAGFAESQRLRVQRYRDRLAPHGEGRVAVERVLLPTDGADDATREHYAAYVEARTARTFQTHGTRRTVIAPDLVGPGARIAEALTADPVFDGRVELRVALPYGFARTEYEQILRDVREHVLPALGWEAA